MTSEELKTQRTESGLTQTRQDKKGALSLGLQIFLIVPWKHFLGDAFFFPGGTPWRKNEKETNTARIEIHANILCQFGHIQICIYNIKMICQKAMLLVFCFSFGIYYAVPAGFFVVIYSAIVLFSIVYYLLFSMNT